MAASDEIVCKIAFWFYRRMALIMALLVLGGLWFLYDGKIGWPKKNIVALAKEGFEAGRDGSSWDEFASSNENFLDAEITDADAIEQIQFAHTDGSKPMPWEEFSLSPGGKDSLAKAEEAKVKKAFEAGSAQAWSDYAGAEGIPTNKEQAESDSTYGVDGFVALKSAFEGSSRKRDWAIYGPLTERKGWNKGDPKYHSKSEITGQYAFAFGLWAIALGTLIWTLINKNRKLTADSESFTTDTGTKVPFVDVFRIDKRKWDNKGLGYAYYRSEGGAEKRATIDDLKYVGADQILDRLMENFEGELVERVTDEVEDGEENEKEPSAEAETTDDAEVSNS